MKSAVAGFESRAFRMGQFAERVVQRRCWKVGVEFGEGVSKACFQDYLVKV